MDENKPHVVATELTPNPDQEPIFHIPLDEMNPSKAGVGDLWNKINEHTRLLNAICSHFKLTEKDLKKIAIAATKSKKE